jgi:RNA polymerase sigma factor (sigma-70 family)
MCKQIYHRLVARNVFQSDEEILEAIRTGVQRDAALKWVYQECKPLIKSLERKFDCSAEDCADVLQEAVWSLYDKVVRGKLTLTAQLTTYMYRVCQNQLMTLKRGSRNMPLVELEDGDGLLEEESTEEELSALEQQLERLLNELGERCRAIIVDFYAGGNSLKELATKYQYSNEKTVTSQKHKCMTQLRRKFQVA